MKPYTVCFKHLQTLVIDYIILASMTRFIVLIVILVHKIFTQMHNVTYIYFILQNAVAVGALAVIFTLSAAQNSGFWVVVVVVFNIIGSLITILILQGTC